MRLNALRNLVRRVAEPLVLLWLRLRLSIGRTIRLRLLETLGCSRTELLRGQHGRVEPVICLRIGTASGRVLATQRLVRRILILRHEHVANTMLGSNVIVKLLVKHDRGGMQMSIQALILSG